MKKRMKKMLSATVAAALLLAVTPAGAEHVHEPAGEYYVDLTNHWYLCECGEKVNEGAHDDLADGECAICNSDLFVYEDGTSGIITYNAAGNSVNWLNYDAAGQLMLNQRWNDIIDEAGNYIGYTGYVDGVLSETGEYVTKEDGSVVFVQTMYPLAEGDSRTVNEFDEHNNLLRTAAYNAQDQIEIEMAYVYSWRDNEWGEKEFYIARETVTNADGSCHVTEYNEHSDKLSEVYYEADGTISMKWQYELMYDTQNNLSTVMLYLNGTLAMESYYDYEQYDPDAEIYSNHYLKMECEYLQEGGWIVYEYSPDGNMLTQTRYDAQGKVIS